MLRAVIRELLYKHHGNRDFGISPGAIGIIVRVVAERLGGDAKLLRRVQVYVPVDSYRPTQRS